MEHFYEAVVNGDAAAVRNALELNPELAVTACGPRNWQPLLYVCFSDTRAGRAKMAELLLEHGADPDASYSPEEYPGTQLSCLYAAAGLHNDVALTRVLLEAGANPDDGESLYHSTEHPGLESMKLLLEHGADAATVNVLRHMLDREDPKGVRLLLEAGADPNEVNQAGETLLHWAVKHARSVEVVRLLIDAGTDLDAKRYDGRSAYAMARLAGLRDVAALLAENGANTDPGKLSPHDAHLLAELAASHRTDAVRELLDLGVPVDSRGAHGGTALHWACWKGYPDLVELLLQRGASLTVTDSQYHATPYGWWDHGSRNCGGGSGYSAVKRLLEAAGAT